jgi:hypothetical protein
LYDDEDGYGKAHYKSEIIATVDSSTNLRDLIVQWWDTQKGKWTARKSMEYRFTLSDTEPETGGFFKVMNYHMKDAVGETAAIIKGGLQFLSKAVGTPSGLGLLNGSSTMFDSWNFPQIDGEDVGYITNIWWREKGSADAWTNFGQPTRVHFVYLPIIQEGSPHIMAGDAIAAYWDGSYHIWNHTNCETFFGAKLSKAIGLEIYDLFMTDDGLEGSQLYYYKAEDGTYKRGDDVYWTTHGFPNGRKYRISVEGGIDAIWLIGTALLVWILQRYKLGGALMKQVSKQLTKRLGKVGLKADIADLMNTLESDPEASRSFKSLNIMSEKLYSIFQRFERAYSPQKGVLRF